MKTRNNENLDLSLGKLPPQAVDIENAVLGALLIESNSFDKISLAADDFYNENNKIIYSAIVKLHKINKPVDLFTVSEELNKNGLLDVVGGPFTITNLTNCVATASNIEYHSLIIHDKYIKRQLIKYCSDIISQSFDNSIDTFDILDKANLELDKINNNILLEDDILPFYEVVKNTISNLEKRAEMYKQGKSIGIPTPISKLSKYTSGWQPKNFVVIGARPGAGKTAMALSIIRTAAEHGKSIFMASLEMSNTELCGRMVVGVSGVSADNFKFGSLESFEWNKIENIISKLSDFKIFIDDKPKNINRIKSKTKLLHRKGQCDILIIDYIQLASVEGENSTRNREQEISYISRSCKTIAQELDIPVIALSQLNREVEKRPNKRPTLSDLRESGSIEQDADMVLFIYRPEMYGLTEDENGEPLNGKSELILAKHRGGQVGTIDFRFNSSLTEVYDIDDFGLQIQNNINYQFEPNTNFDNEKSDLKF